MSGRDSDQRSTFNTGAFPKRAAIVCHQNPALPLRLRRHAATVLSKYASTPRAPVCNRCQAYAGPHKVSRALLDTGVGVYAASMDGCLLGAEEPSRIAKGLCKEVSMMISYSRPHLLVSKIKVV